MVTEKEYVDAVRDRLAADGCELTDEELDGVPVVVGYRRHFKALTRLHTFTVVAALDRIDAVGVETTTHRAVDLAFRRKGQWAGVQSGVLVLPILVAPRVDWDAVTCVRHPFMTDKPAAMAHPVVVDVSAGAIHTFRGTRFIGLLYNGLIKRKIAAYVPEPR